ncbi:MAG: TIGR04086 family membrane protein [Actinomycetota bacterium]
MKSEPEETTARPLLRARGGVSIGAVLTGVVVSFGAMFLLTAAVAGVLYAFGVDLDVGEGESIQAGPFAGAALIVAQFLAYLWGGYTAGRMSRGAGAANGFLVALIALFLAVGAGAVLAAVSETPTGPSLPFTSARIPLQDEYVVDWGLGVALGAMLAMFLGGITGGLAGSRWHSRLESRTLAESEEKIETPAPTEPERADEPKPDAEEVEEARPPETRTERHVYR